MFAKERDNGGEWRLGLAVTRKTGCAVVRNRVKRVLREFFRLNQALLPGDVDIVVVPKRSARPKDLTLTVAEKEFLPLLPNLAAISGDATEGGPGGA